VSQKWDTQRREYLRTLGIGREIAVDEGAERQQTAVLVGGEFAAERLPNGTVRTGEFPCLLVADVGVGEDVARLVVLVRVTVEGQPEMERNADEQARRKGEGDDPEQFILEVHAG
jgi:hypothetical protein